MVCDMIVHTLFHSIIKNSIRDFHSLIELHYKCLPDISKMDNDDILTTFELPRTSPPKVLNASVVCIIIINTSKITVNKLCWLKKYACYS